MSDRTDNDSMSPPVMVLALWLVKTFVSWDAFNNQIVEMRAKIEAQKEKKCKN